MPLHNLQNSGFFFSQDEAYLILLIYKAGCEGKFNKANILAQCDLVQFPHTLWGMVQSAENLTPRGLKDTFSTNEEDFLQSHQLDSFLLSKRREDVQEEEKDGEIK